MFTTQVYVPIAMAPAVIGMSRPLENRRLRWVQVFGRLKPGLTAHQAKASLAPLFHNIQEMEVQQQEFAHASAETRREFLTGCGKTPLRPQDATS
jgi:hypothetical protein